jgi:hypothetical protein
VLADGLAVVVAAVAGRALPERVIRLGAAVIFLLTGVATIAQALVTVACAIDPRDQPMPHGTAAQPARPPSSRRRPAWPVRALLVFGGLVLPLVALEGLLRLPVTPLPGDYQTAAFTARSALLGRQNQANTAGWRHTAEFTTWVRVNSHGLRGPELDYAKSPCTLRILALGDSFTFAMQVDETETLVARLVEYLPQAATGPTVEVINGGTDGWTTANELAWFTVEGHRYEADLVLLMFFVGNDPGENDDLVGTPEVLQRLKLGADAPAGPLELLRQELRGRSAAVNFLEQGVLAKREPAPVRGWSDERIPKEQRRLDTERKARGWAISELLIARLRAVAEEHGAQLVVVGIPTAGQVLDPASEPGPLAGIGERAGIPVVDLLEEFHRLPPGDWERLYFDRNQHWTPFGHDIAARIVAERLEGVVSWPTVLR